jgi:hypothetical protein
VGFSGRGSQRHGRIGPEKRTSILEPAADGSIHDSSCNADFKGLISEDAVFANVVPRNAARSHERDVRNTYSLRQNNLPLRSLTADESLHRGGTCRLSMSAEVRAERSEQSARSQDGFVGNYS